MIKLPSLPLDASAATDLSQWQVEIDSISDYETRVNEGKRLFGSRNNKRNSTFINVREVLTKMCHGHKRCGYCEDSVADEVEHIAPKDLYPEAVFSWKNYLYACGPCNGPKNNKYAVVKSIPSAQVVDVTRHRNAPVLPPIAGQPALINPRLEDPLSFLWLDIANTFVFLPMEGLSRENELRAEYTIKVLRLNHRDYLVDSRRTAFGSYRSRLREYIEEKANGADQLLLNLRQQELRNLGHRTVWLEMQRQHRLYPVLDSLFSHAPEALAW